MSRILHVCYSLKNDLKQLENCAIFSGELQNLADSAERRLCLQVAVVPLFITLALHLVAALDGEF